MVKREIKKRHIEFLIPERELSSVVRAMRERRPIYVNDVHQLHVDALLPA
jgi:hypothetical protein